MSQWKIEKLSDKEEDQPKKGFEMLGIFNGTKDGFLEIKRALEVYNDTEEGKDYMYRFTNVL